MNNREGVARPFLFYLILTQADVKNPARGHKVEKTKTSSGREKCTTYSTYNEKMVMVHNTRKSNISKETKNKEETKTKKGRRHFLGNCVWQSGRMHIEERLNEGPRL